MNFSLFLINHNPDLFPGKKPQPQLRASSISTIGDYSTPVTEKFHSTPKTEFPGVDSRSTTTAESAVKTSTSSPEDYGSTAFSTSQPTSETDNESSTTMKVTSSETKSDEAVSKSTTGMVSTDNSVGHLR
ncbi:hypothetical protein CDAR_39411 [Caerostris darwini]|uniref:Uncharacterized protein n=1 Tax=Caerostris darwini TaxID=1538125 RepID=A0AAV4U6D4_9ARAC|nr:hypothetical protein CDAR_39411 [Caerostris darwini]